MFYVRYRKLQLFREQGVDCLENKRFILHLICVHKCGMQNLVFYKLTLRFFLCSSVLLYYGKSTEHESYPFNGFLIVQYNIVNYQLSFNKL